MKKYGDEEIERAKEILKDLKLKPGETFLMKIENFLFSREEIKVTPINHFTQNCLKKISS